MSVRGDSVPGDTHWYACYTRSRHEKRVAQTLERAGREVFLPLFPKVTQWHDRRKTVHWPLFPGYVFVRFSASHMHEIVATHGVVSIVGQAGRPRPVPENEILSVRKFTEVLAETGSVPIPEPLVTEGERVQVKEGSLEGVEGIVLENRGKGRTLIQVGVEAIGQGVKIELDTRTLKTLLVST